MALGGTLIALVLRHLFHIWLPDNNGCRIASALEGAAQQILCVR
jgi:hypothetical protein